MGVGQLCVAWSASTTRTSEGSPIITQGLSVAHRMGSYSGPMRAGGGGITDQRCSLLRGGNPPRMTDTIGALENSCGRRIDGDACEGRLLARAGQQRMGFPEGTQALGWTPGVQSLVGVPGAHEPH